MPVLVSGADGAALRAVLAALVRRGGDVRAVVDPGVASSGLVERLRAAGVRTARGTLDDEALLESAAAGAHTLVHAVEPLGEPDALVDDTASLVSTALGVGARRMLLLSHVGADPLDANPWLAALGEAEALVVDAPLATVVVRRALTYGVDDPLTDAVAEGAPGADPDALHAPLWAADLAAAVVAADERDAPGVPHLLVPLGGPRTTSLGELIALLGGQIRTGAHARLPDGSTLPAHVVDLLSRDLVPDRDAPAAGTSPEAGGEQVRAAFAPGP